MRAYLRKLDLDVDAFPADLLFELLDVDGGGEVAFEEFTHGLSQLKGFAKSFDIYRMQLDMVTLSGNIQDMRSQQRSLMGVVQHILQLVMREEHHELDGPEAAEEVEDVNHAGEGPEAAESMEDQSKKDETKKPGTILAKKKGKGSPSRNK